MKVLEKGIIPINYYQIDALLKRFVYFQKYSENVRKRLLDFGKLRVYEKDEIIFRQGDPSPSFFFMLRGTVSYQVTKSDMGNVPCIIKIIYDGQDFGEQAFLKEFPNFAISRKGEKRIPLV